VFFMQPRFSLAVILCIAALAGVPACAQDSGQPVTPAGNDQPATATNPSAADAPSQAATPTPVVPETLELRIAPGDLLDIEVFGVPEMKQQARVSAGGNIMMPMIGAVAVNGMTTMEAQARIAQQLMDGNFLNNPSVSVMIREYSTQGISVLGEVNKPGIYPLLGARRLFDAISAAGGTTPRAGRIVSITRRTRPDEPLTVSLDYDPDKNKKANIDILPGDTVVVSRAGVVYVVGEVTKPGGFTMENNERLTVLQALALAGGASKFADMKKAQLIRQTPVGRQEVPISLKAILTAGAKDVPMQADDILFVPGSPGKSAFRRSIDAIVQIATGAAIYSTLPR
jgi:polysaccharide export outer membrane protein